MSDYYDKTRLIVARMEGEKHPLVIGAIAETTWEIIPPDEWDRIRRDLAQQWLGPDWTAYDYIEVVMTFPSEELSAMFDAREIKPVSMVADPLAGKDEPTP